LKAESTTTEAVRKPAFTIIELLVVVAIIAIVMGMLLPAMANARARSRSLKCIANLKQIGTAAKLYVDENDNKMPYAYLRRLNANHVITWDDLLSRNMGIALTSNEIAAPFTPAAKENKLLHCPSDRVGLAFGETRNSYTLAGHNMAPTNLPPRSDIRTGIGMFWRDDTLTPPALPVGFDFFRENLVLTPTSTLLVTELIASNNVAGNDSGTTLSAANAHIRSGQVPFGVNVGNFHNRRYTYLLIDGHVDFLEPVKTVGTGTLANPGGMWTVLSTD